MKNNAAENIKYLFFDVDDTLFDFRKCGTAAIRNGFEKFGLKYDENVPDIFFEINRGFWKRIEKGEITRDYLSAHRFDAVFAALGIEFDGPVFEEEFRRGIYSSCEEVEGAVETVKTLSEKYPLFVASNSYYDQQYNRLRLAGIEGCFRGIFVSEDIGYAKPSQEFFTAALKKAGVKNPSEAMMIGDSPDADITGACSVGMRTCWLNAAGGSDKRADYVIDDIRKLVPLLIGK